MSEFTPCASPACTACQEVQRLREQLAAVEALHHLNTDPRDGSTRCDCGEPYCRTIAALDPGSEA